MKYSPVFFQNGTLQGIALLFLFLLVPQHTQESYSSSAPISFSVHVALVPWQETSSFVQQKVVLHMLLFLGGTARLCPPLQYQHIVHVAILCHM